MSLLSHFSQPTRRFGLGRRKAAHAANPSCGPHAATLSRDELLREVIAVLG